MAAYQDVREIRAWRLAHQLNLRVDLFLLSPDFKRNYTAFDQLVMAARTGPRQIAEGSERLRQKEFAQYVRAAKLAQAVVLHHLVDARQQLLITDDEFALTKQLAKRAMRAAERLIRSLETNGLSASSASIGRIPPRSRSVPTGLGSTIPCDRSRIASPATPPCRR